MPTAALLVLDKIQADPQMSQPARAKLVTEEVPSWQWAVPDGHWADLSKHCPNREEPELPLRPVNGLNIEIGRPQDRCLFRSPVEHGSNLLWLLSGGSVLDYGKCEQCECHWVKSDT